MQFQKETRDIVTCKTLLAKLGTSMAFADSTTLAVNLTVASVVAAVAFKN
jgi:hypothetical protein